MEKDIILDVQNLNISFKTKNGALSAIRNLSFQLERGKTFAIVGESGCGKSITVKTLVGITSRNEIVSGKALYASTRDGTTRDILSMKRRQLIRNICGKCIAMVFQDPMTTLDPTMTVGNQILEAMRQGRRIGRAEGKRRTLELLGEVGITDPEARAAQYPHQLSGGMRQRIVIAIMLACEPDILICDEPTTALDVTIQARILELIQAIQKAHGLTVVYITHDLGVVAKVADTVAVMYAGKIVEQGEADEIFHDPRHPYTWGLLNAVPKLTVDQERLYNIPGAPPYLLGPIRGDAFAPRNPYALEIDYRQEPPRFDVSETHFVYSWLEDPRAPDVEAMRRSRMSEGIDCGAYI